jgi:Flp pilus assembly pilin Flp
MSNPVRNFYENLHIHLERFIDDEEAATMVEYIMLAVGASLILITVLPRLSSGVTSTMSGITTNMGAPTH